MIEWMAWAPWLLGMTAPWLRGPSPALRCTRARGASHPLTAVPEPVGGAYSHKILLRWRQRHRRPQGGGSNTGSPISTKILCRRFGNTSLTEDCAWEGSTHSLLI